MNKVLKLQRIGLMTPTAVEYKGKILATNQLDIESTCNLWRNHFGFYPTEGIDLAMTECFKTREEAEVRLAELNR